MLSIIVPIAILAFVLWATTAHSRSQWAHTRRRLKWALHGTPIHAVTDLRLGPSSRVAGTSLRTSHKIHTAMDNVERRIYDNRAAWVREVHSHHRRWPMPDGMMGCIGLTVL